MAKEKEPEPVKAEKAQVKDTYEENARGRELTNQLGHSFVARDYLVSTLVFGLAYLAYNQFAPMKASAVAAGGAVVEPATGFAFDPLLRVDGKELSLLGVGVRSKLVVSVYAAGFYAEASAMRSATAPLLALPLHGEPQLFVALAAASAAKYCVLTFARDVAATKVAEAFLSSPGGSAKSRKELEACIVTQQGDLKKGDQLALSWRGTDGFAVKSGFGTTLCSFRDRPLAEGLLGMYLGKDAVSPKLKASIADGIKALHV
ncbi:chalcone isomerase [Pavlovales sp. CCMP2436]|nr:chalcone isomerase [Pavlovales sp. CCMP2436]|mmetsp:Transcript_45061/g.111683  ORF Transcript_45061/g.111683 Transcript_45061/m.111683 type:complete len:260 (-) Transcript_45061:238-1017(-)